LTTFDDLQIQLVAIEQAHTEKRFRVGSIDRDTPRLTIPENDRLVDIEGDLAPIPQHRAAIPAKGKAERRNEIRRKSEIAVKARVDHGFDRLFPTLKTTYGEAHDRFAIGVHPAGDHRSQAAVVLKRGPKRRAYREPTCRVQTCASGWRARRRSEATTSSRSTS
jgi:hypothetical protein